MQVREVSGACGSMPHIVPTVWRADAATICVLLDNPVTGRWLVITVDLTEKRDEPVGAHHEEAA